MEEDAHDCEDDRDTTFLKVDLDEHSADEDEDVVPNLAFSVAGGVSSAKILSRRLTVPVPEADDNSNDGFGIDIDTHESTELVDDEPPSPTGCSKKHSRRFAESPKKRHDYRMQLEDIEIEVIEESSSDEHEHLSDNEAVE